MSPLGCLDTYITFNVEQIPDLKQKAYVAKLIGKHPTYRYKRLFCNLTGTHTKIKNKPVIRYTADVDDYGVYECCIKFFWKDSKDYIIRRRTFFCMYDGERYDINSSQVLPAIEWIHRYLRDYNSDAV